MPTASANHFREIVDASDDAIFSKDTNATLVSWNPAAERLYGYRADEAIGQPVSILIPPERAGEEARILGRIVRGERIERYETERVRKDGRRVIVELAISPLREPAGEVSGAAVIARDVGERVAVRERAERLQRITVELSGQIDPEQTLDVLLTRTLPVVGADAGGIWLFDRLSGELVLEGSAGYAGIGIGAWERVALDANLPLSDVVRNREPMWLESREELWTRYPELAGTRPAFASLAIVPFLSGEQPLGGVTLSFREPRTFPPEERAFMIATAAQAAHALERSRLFASERRRLEQLAFIAEANELLVSSLEVDAILKRLASLAVPRLGDWCSIDLATEDGGIRNVAVAHADPSRVELAADLQARYPVDPDATTGAPNVIRTGRSELYPTIPDELLAEAAVDEAHLRLMRALGLVSAMVIPLTARGRTLGAMTVVAAESGQHYGEDDLRLAEELARRAGLAVDNATLYRREHDAAMTLQRALLPQRLPAPDGAQVAARYLPAGSGLAVGGDWYDMVETDDGGLALVVGDVAGRGLQAAAVMGRLRMALRAYVLDGHRPAAAVERLDALMTDLDEMSMATLVHLSLDPSRGRVEYVRAGHPRPLLRAPDGHVSELGGSGSPPVGVGSHAPFRSTSFDLEPDSLLLLYTDGLVERRAEGLAPGIAKLRETLADSPIDAEDCVERVVADLGAAELGDDAAVVAIRLLGESRIRSR